MERKYILFDLDGTLTDPMMGITKSVRYALNYYGINVDSLNDLLPFIGPPLRDSFKEFYGFDDEGIFDNKVYEGIPECLQKLKDAGKILLVATSKPEKFAKQIIEYFDLDKYFDFIGGSEFNGREKKADVIKYVLKANHIDASKAIMVGDRRYDIIGAHENDLPCVGVLYGYGSLEELKGNRADYLADTIIELTSLLLEL